MWIFTNVLLITNRTLSLETGLFGSSTAILLGCLGFEPGCCNGGEAPLPAVLVLKESLTNTAFLLSLFVRVDGLSTGLLEESYQSTYIKFGLR